jgi:DNA modification methylase
MEKLVWKNEARRLKDLRPFKGNPRKATEEEIKNLTKSLDNFNLADPLVINTDGEVIGGNFRLSLLKKKKGEEEKIDVRLPNRKLTRREAEELNLRLNKNQGSWDLELLANFGEDLLKEVGFESEALDEIFGLEIDDNFDIEKEIEKAIKEPRGVKVGDLWQLGQHKLTIGDCVDKKAWKRLLGEEKFDFLFTDPPYKLAYTQRLRKVKTKEGAKLKKDKVYESVGKTDRKGRFKGWVKTKAGFGYRAQRSYLGVESRGGVPEYDEWLSIANDFQNQRGANVMIFENWRNCPELWRAVEKYWKIRNMIIWWLPNRCQGFSRPGYFFNKYDIVPLAGNGEMNQDYEKEFEIYLKEKGQALLDTYEVMLYGNQGKHYWDRKKKTKWAQVNDHITHSAETAKSGGQNIIFGTKPIQILVPYIKILSPRNGIVMEPFAGSGSTIIASEIMKRRCLAIELEPIYGEVIIRRFEKFTGQKAIKLG